MKKLFKYLAPYKKWVIAAPICMIIEVVSELMVPNIMSGIVDIGMANNDMKYIISHGLLIVFFALLGAFGGIACPYFASKAAMYFGSDVREAMFKRIQGFSFVNLDRFQTSSLVTRLTNDITQLQQIVIMSLRGLVRSPVTFIGGLFMAFRLNAKLTMVLFAAIVFMIFVISFLLSKSFPLFQKVQLAIDNVNTVMRENLSGIRLVKAFVRDKKEIEKFNEKNTDLKMTTIKAFRLMTIMAPTMMVVMNAVMLTIVWQGGHLVYSGTMPAGDLMAYITYITQILMSLMMASMLLMMVSRARACTERINEVLDTEYDITDCENPVQNAISEGVIEFKNVYFSYPGSKGDPVLKDISFKINPGETVGILGETGAGKSTLVNLIPRLYDATQGSVTIDGVNIKDMPLEYLRKAIGIVLQKAILFSGTIKDNIKWGKDDATDEEVINACKIAGAYEFIAEMPEGFDTVLGQGGVNLSGGQKQRLSIARTIIKKPKILIFDDSTSAVDTGTEKKIQTALKNNLADTTKIIIAQKISSIMHADKIIVLSGGEISAVGTHEQLLTESEIYREICNSQLKKEDD